MTLEFHDGRPLGEDGEGWKDRDPRQPGPQPEMCGLTRAEVAQAINDMATDEYVECAWRVIVKILLDSFLYAIDMSPELRRNMAASVVEETERRVRERHEDPDQMTEKALRRARNRLARITKNLFTKSIVSEEFLEPMMKQARRRMKKPKGE